ncbi:hypothetical protein ACQLRU_000999 [Escherichia coli]|uniref:hypothetical protein n=1 Tax=Escherichia coli TaxID=562 RepID=UPI000E20D442|nr:hypothetical protein [Escherichia coli]EHR9617128.1 hypothetical protein [Escherichia coli]EII3500946.1 hypothetical protein [Escherichia coli]EIL3091039.1 hypothetical protein [Escherichia coli]EIQ0273435.1 hypothetical protein [Escherichia coli]EIY0803971.1 hypothetical protein [Escherichia coli]
MKEFNGTPGKWSFSHNSASDASVACIEINSSESLHEIAYLQSTPSRIGGYNQTSFDKTIANAHLIAAAPDLLNALQAMLNKAYKQNWNDHYPDEVSKAQSAISKALGDE